MNIYTTHTLHIHTESRFLASLAICNSFASLFDEDYRILMIETGAIFLFSDIKYVNFIFTHYISI